MASLISCPLFENSLRHPRDEAIVWGRRTITWELLNGYVHSTSRHLTEIGLRPGMRAGILVSDRTEDVILLFSLWRAGVSACPLDPRMPKERFKDAVDLIRPALIFVGGESARPKSYYGVKTVVTDNVLNYQYTAGFWGSEEALAPQVDLAAEATIVLTSGSSGRPKAVRLTYGNHYWNAIGSNEFIPFGIQDRWLLSLPLFHVSGLGVLFRALVGGGAVVVPSAGELRELIMACRPTHLSVVPTQLERLLNDVRVREVLQSMKCVLLGGAPIPPNLTKACAELGIPLYVTYGMTETASQIATGRVEADGRAFVKLLKYREVKIDEHGEVLVRGEVLFSGYLETESDGKIFDQDGWFGTGDLGILEGNSLKIIGRRDNMFISGGENIYPEAIERMLSEHPAIEGAVVVPVDDPEFGMRPVTFILEKTGAKIRRKDLEEFLNERLSRHECPRDFYRWPDTLATTGSKVDRKVFAQMIKDGLVRERLFS